MNEAAFRALISGETEGVAASLGRGGLSLLSLGYGFGVRARNAAYDRGLTRMHRAAVPVVSVGNVTTGGTGKTPFVAEIVARLRSRGASPAILSRGYRADASGVNDEKRVLDRLCPGVPHLQNRDRVASAEAAVREHAATVLVLDDGFQHRRLHRDLDVVLIDASNPWGHGRLLPRGLLREPRASLRRADLVVLTRVDQVDEAARAAIRERVHSVGADLPVVEVAYPATTLVALDGSTRPLSELGSKRVTAFCGIGNPAGFRRLLDDAGLDVAAFRELPDHHHYAAGDVRSLTELAAKADAPTLLTTEKDLVKLDGFEIDAARPYAVRIGTRLVAGEGELDAALDRLLAGTLPDVPSGSDAATRSRADAG